MEKIIPISDLQSKTKEVVEGVKRTGRPVIITQRGRIAAVIVNCDEYEKIQQKLDELNRTAVEGRSSIKRR